MLQSPVYAAEDTVFVAISSKWSYYVTDTDGFHDIDKDWTTAALDGDWSIGSAPFGDRIDHSNAEKSGWTGEDHAIFARQSFTLKSATAFKNLHFYLSAYYDNTIHVYLNGTEIFAHDNAGSSDWVDDYVTIELKDAGKLLQKGEVSVGVYPEGTRSKECRLLPFHNGVFKIAQRAEAPIVIVAISGTEKVSKNYPLHKTDVYVDVLDVLSAEWVKTAQTDDIGELVKDKLYKHLSEK